MTGPLPPPDEPTRGAQPIGRDRRVLPRKFYAIASVVAQNDGWQLLLDGRPAKTPGKRPLAVPHPTIANRLATEWNQQVAHIEPATMPLTTLACTAIDAVAFQADAVAGEIVKFSGTDLLCYRAESPEELVAAEAAAWDPILDWAARDLGAVFAISSGLAHISQSDATTAQIARAIGRRHPLSLAALHVLTTLTGSAVLALAVDRRHLSIADAWRTAHIDEDWQIAKWGEDAEAMERRAIRHREAVSAAWVLDALHP